jgi:two-component system, LytTR family, response regulator
VTAAISAVIADDEALARRTIRELLAGAGDIRVVAECRDGVEAAAAIGALAPELVFLDVRMPGLDGFAALRRAAGAPVVVFVTAHEGHAIAAFDADAADFLLKPFDDDRFFRAVARARGAVQHRRLRALAASIAPPRSAAPAPASTPAATAPPEVQATPPNRIAIRDGARLELVDPAEIDWIRAEGCYAQLHVGRRELLVREPLADLEARLGPARFVRIHRSALVNVDRVRTVERLGRGELAVVLADGTRMRVSRGRRGELERVVRPR